MVTSLLSTPGSLSPHKRASQIQLQGANSTEEQAMMFTPSTMYTRLEEIAKSPSRTALCSNPPINELDKRPYLRLPLALTCAHPGGHKFFISPQKGRSARFPSPRNKPPRPPREPWVPHRESVRDRVHGRLYVDEQRKAATRVLEFLKTKIERARRLRMKVVEKV
jgi:hypothetical protein